MSKQKPAHADSRRAQLRAAQIKQAKAAKNRRIAMIALACVVVLALAAGVVLLVNRANEAKLASIPPNANADRDAIVVNPGKARGGTPTVSLFFDYQCPACAQFEKTYGAKLEELANRGDITLQYRTLTFLDTNLRNDSSIRAANAALCADLAGHYSAYHNTVFANQPAEEGTGFTDDALTKDFPQKAGMTGPALAEFTTCYSARRYNGYVKNSDAQAGKAGVTGTPSMQVNGKDLNLKNLTEDPNSLQAEIAKLA